MALNFLKLPTEIRYMTYDFICDDDTEIRDGKIDIECMSPKRAKGAAAMIHTCQAIRQEFAPLYLSSFKIYIQLGQCFNAPSCHHRDWKPRHLKKCETFKWLKDAGSEVTAYISNLRVEFELENWDTGYGVVPARFRLAVKVDEKHGPEITLSYIPRHQRQWCLPTYREQDHGCKYLGRLKHYLADKCKKSKTKYLGSEDLFRLLGVLRKIRNEWEEENEIEYDACGAPIMDDWEEVQIEYDEGGNPIDEHGRLIDYRGDPIDEESEEEDETE